MNDAVQVLVLAAGVKPWALGAFVFLLGLGGLVLLAFSDWEKSSGEEGIKSELLEGAFFLCGLMVVAPLLMLLPEAVRREMPDYLLVIVAVVTAVGVLVAIHFVRKALRRWVDARPHKPQRQGRPSSPGLGKRGKKFRNRKS